VPFRGQRGRKKITEVSVSKSRLGLLFGAFQRTERKEEIPEVSVSKSRLALLFGAFQRTERKEENNRGVCVEV